MRLSQRYSLYASFFLIQLSPSSFPSAVVEINSVLAILTREQYFVPQKIKYFLAWTEKYQRLFVRSTIYWSWKDFIIIWNFICWITIMLRSMYVFMCSWVFLCSFLLLLETHKIAFDNKHLLGIWFKWKRKNISFSCFYLSEKNRIECFAVMIIKCIVIWENWRNFLRQHN